MKEEKKKATPVIRVGDSIQWLCGGAFMFDPLAKVRGLSECGQFCFVEGTATGIPVDQVVEVKRASAERYLSFARQLSVYYGRLVAKEGAEKWGYCLRTVDRWGRLINNPRPDEARMLHKQVAGFDFGPAWKELTAAFTEWISEYGDEPKTTNPGGLPK